MRRFIALLLLLGACGLASRASAAVLITFDDTVARVYDGTTAANSDTNGIQNSGGAIAVAALPGHYSTTISLFNSASMSGSFVQSRSGNPESYSDGWVNVYFTTDADVPYTVAGTFANSAGFTYLAAQLYDSTTSSYLFQSYQLSSSGPAAFTLGGSFTGSLTGTLLAGHDYQWYGRANTQANTTDGGAEASGGVSLTIGAAAVPEFSSVIVWSLLALTIGGAGWWRQSKLAA